MYGYLEVGNVRQLPNRLVEELEGELPPRATELGHILFGQGEAHRGFGGLKIVVF